MAIWLGLIIAPLLALTDQTVAFALVGPGCASQTTLVLHASHAIFLALAVAATVAAWRHWRQTGAPGAVASGNAHLNVQRHFLAGVAATVAALSAAAIVAMWVPTWLISPCVA